MEKATRQQLRDHNTRLVLKTIFDQGEISRADIARRTHLTRPTVSTIVADLLDQGYVLEAGQGPSAGGKRPTLVSLNADGPRLLCLDLSRADFHAALVSLTGRVEQRATRPAAGLNGSAALDHVIQLATSLQEAASAPLLGVGVASPGLVDPHNGIVLRAVNLGWVNVPLRDLLEEALGLPVYVANDSHMAALAEYTFGDGRDADNLIVIHLGEGIGAGIVLHGRPFYGDGFGAGEIGHVVVEADGALCTCGNRGCLETTSSVRAMLRDAQATTGQSVGPLAWADFVRAVQEGDRDVRPIAERAGRSLGVAIANLVGSYNIRHIVLTGPGAELGGTLLAPAVDEARRRVLPSMADSTVVSGSSLGSDTITLGCSALVLHRELGIV